MSQSKLMLSMQRMTPERQKLAQKMFDKPAPEGYLEEWKKYLAVSNFASGEHAQGVIIFDVGGEALAWPVTDLQVTLNARPIHVLPNRRSRVLLGVAHVRGALLPCMSLAMLLGLKKEDGMQEQPLLMVGDRAQPWLFGVELFRGFYLYQQKELIDMPNVIEDQHVYFSQGVFEFKGKSVTLLDPALVLSGFGREV